MKKRGRLPTVQAAVSPDLSARLDAIAASWGLTRSATLRRLIETADVDGVAPPVVPSIDELLVLAAERARCGNVAAMSFIASRQPDDQETRRRQLLARFNGG